VSRTLPFAEKLGLAPDGPYVVFDFWAQRLLGVYRGRMVVDIASHDTRVLLIHPLADRPQLVGLSRHITGAFSVADLGWNSARQRLHGVAETVEGEPYTLWIHLPDGTGLGNAEARSGSEPVRVERRVNGSELMIRFTGQKAPVEWMADFSVDR